MYKVSEDMSAKWRGIQLEKDLPSFSKVKKISKVNYNFYKIYEA